MRSQPFPHEDYLRERLPEKFLFVALSGRSLKFDPSGTTLEVHAFSAEHSHVIAEGIRP